MELLDDNIWVGSFGDINIVVCVIGYPFQGESIVVSLQDKQKPIFTIVTDCYQECDNNFTANLLRDMGVDSIDVFVWTHPDQDHSVGIIGLLDEFDKNRKARVFVPQSFDGSQRYSVCNDAEKAIKYLMQYYNERKKYHVDFISLCEGEQPRVVLSKRIYQPISEKPVYMKLRFLAPIGSLVGREASSGTDFTLNDLSIVYLLSLSNCHYLFTGDLIDRTTRFFWKQIYDEDEHERYDNYLYNLRFIKIPHHGSSSSEGFLRYLESNLIKNDSQESYPVSVSTVFVRDNLPKTDILKGYGDLYSRVFCTGNSKNARFGCVKTTYNFDGSLKNNPELFGNAYSFC